MLFVRNAPRATAEFLVLEQLLSTEKEPWLGEYPHFNALSPLHCYLFRWTDALAFGATRCELAKKFFARRDFVEAAVAENGLVLEYASDILKRDEAVVRAALDQNGLALQFADLSFRRNRDLVEAAISSDARALEFADDNLQRDNRDLVLQAVSTDGRALKFAHESYKKDRDIVLKAVTNHGAALRYAHRTQRGDSLVVLAAFKQSAAALSYASAALWQDQHFLTAIGFLRCSQQGPIHNSFWA